MQFVKGGFRLRLPTIAGVVVFAMPLMATAGQNPVTVEPVVFEPDGQHLGYRMHLEVQGSDMYWDVVQGSDLTRISPDEDYQTGISGHAPLYTGPALDDRAHDMVQRFGAFAPALAATSSRPPLEYEDVFDNLQRTDGVRVIVQPADERRELAGRDASAYTLAVVSDMSRRYGDEWRSYHTVNYGTVWIYDDMPFSPAPLQLSGHVFDLVFAPNSGMAGLAGYYQDRLIQALEPLGMLAGARMQGFQVSDEMLATLEEQDWQLVDEQRPGQPLGGQFELLTTEFTADAEPLDYAALEGAARMDGSGLEYLEGPLMLSNMLGLCPAPPEDVSTDELLAVMEEHASFRGTMEGPLDGVLLGEAGFGSQDDGFGRGFVIAAETYDQQLERAACLALLRVGGGKPDEAGPLVVAAGAGDDDAQTGELIAYLVVADLTEAGVVREIAVGVGDGGTVELDAVSGESVSGRLAVSGMVTTLDDLTRSEPFEIEGEFTAPQAWDRVPTTR